MNRSWIKYVSAAIVGALIVLIVCWSEGLFLGPELQKAYRIICDGCFISSVLLIGIGLMCMISNEGIFDVLSYGVINIFRIFHPSNKVFSERESFYDYRMRKHGKKVGFAFMLIVGSVYLAAAFVFMFLVI